MDPSQHTLLAFGVCVMSVTADAIELVFKKQFNLYVEDETTWSWRCYAEFWSKHLDQLKTLHGPEGRTHDSLVKHAVGELLKLRCEYERLALEKTGAPLIFTTDNPQYDIPWLNYSTSRFFPDVEPIPYSATPPQTYSTVVHIGMVALGILLTKDPSAGLSPWSGNKKLSKLEGWGEPPVEHDHTPANDAHTIAWHCGKLLQRSFA